MARGKQKIAAQEKKAKRSQAKNKGSQLDARQAGVQKVCKICYAQMHNLNNMKLHYEAKHAGKPFIEADYV